MATKNDVNNQENVTVSKDGNSKEQVVDQKQQEEKTKDVVADDSNEDENDSNEKPKHHHIQHGHRNKELHRLYTTLLEDYPVNLGKAISKKQREREHLKDPTLVYGEIKYNFMALMFRVMKDDYDGLQKAGGVFYDLGSGTGKPVFAAAILHTFERCVGVEKLSQLYTASLEITDHWRKLTDSVDDDIMSAEQKRCMIEFINDDIKNPEFSMSDATVGFANSTCYDEELMIHIASKADEMVAGSFFITVTKRLPSLQWDLLEMERYKMSWGEANVFLHRKKDDDWQEQQLEAEARQKEEEEEEERARKEAEQSSGDEEEVENLLVGGEDGSGLL